MSKGTDPVPILAEPGSTANGDLPTFHRLLDVAIAAGCTAFKPEWTSNPATLRARRHTERYANAYRAIAYPREWHVELGAAVRVAGLTYVVSVYLPEDVATLAPYVDAFKCASFEAQDPAMLAAFRASGKPLYISTGMCDVADVVRLASVATAVLHCTSAYPAPADSLNLEAIRTMRAFVACPVGYSDHSANVITGALAVAHGANGPLEVHMRLDDTDPGNPDYRHSLTPAQLAVYVANVRFEEAARGDGVKRCMPAEQPMQRYRVTA